MAGGTFNRKDRDAVVEALKLQPGDQFDATVEPSRMTARVFMLRAHVANSCSHALLHSGTGPDSPAAV